MAVTITPNIGLRIAENATPDARYNLERLDILGATFTVDTTSELLIRSQTNILVEPQSADLGGSGAGGVIRLSTANNKTADIQVHGKLRLTDAFGVGTGKLQIKYDSTADGSAADGTDRILTIDVAGADRSLLLGGNFQTTGGNLTFSLSGNTTLALPVAGTIVVTTATQTLTNKTIDADLNTLSNIDNNEIKALAGITLTKLAATTALRALVSDASGFINPSAVTSTELGYVSGVTSAIQSQINNRLSIGSSVVGGDQGKILFVDAGAILGQSVNLFWSTVDERLGIGTSSPTEKLQVDGNIRVSNAGSVKFRELTANGISAVSIKAPDSLAANYTLTLPLDNGDPSQFLQTDGSGNLAWASGSGGSISIGDTIGGSPSDGSFLFVAAGSILQETGSPLFWDSSGARLGIGTTTPSVKLTVIGTTAGAAYFSVPSSTTNSIVFLHSDEVNAKHLILEAYDADVIGFAQISISARAIASSYDIVLPAAQGANGDTLRNDGTGVLSWAPATSSIGGTLTGATAGSVLFAGSGTFAQDNANLFWDNTSNFLGIGTASPTAKLEVVDTSGSPAARITQHDNNGTGLSVVVDPATGGTGIQIDVTGTAADGIFINGVSGGRYVVLGNGTANLGVSPSASMATDYDFTFPPDVGNNGDVMQNDGTGATFWTAFPTGGTYSPSLTNVANLSASTSFAAQYMQVGSTVTVSGKVSVDPILAATTTQLGISIPVASTFTTDEQAGGVAFCPTVAAQGAAIYADAANSRVQMEWKSTDITNQPMYFTFTYQVL